MTASERLIKAAVQTLVSEGRSLEDAQVSALMTLSKIAASSGPKNLQRLVAENRIALIAGRAEEAFTVNGGVSENVAYLPVPKLTVAAARGWLDGLGQEENQLAAELIEILYPT